MDAGGLAISSSLAGVYWSHGDASGAGDGEIRVFGRIGLDEADIALEVDGAVVVVLVAGHGDADGGSGADE